MNSKNLLFVRPDHIGDYIIFRNIMYAIKKSSRFKDYKVFFVVNQRVKELVEFFDPDLADGYFYVDLQKYILGQWYYERKNQEICQYQYDTVINAMFARHDALERFIGSVDAGDKILVKDRVHQNRLFDAAAFDKNYMSVYDITDNKVFEFDQLKSVFETILNEKILQAKPALHLPDSWQMQINFDFDYIVVFIGADAEYRKWSVYNYIELIRYILHVTDLAVVLCGGNEESDDADAVAAAVAGKKFYNLVGETSLVDVVALISNSKLMISNETGSVHIAAALDKPVFVLSNANHFGKFTPYPASHVQNYFALYPFEYDENSFMKYKELYYNGSALDINEIGIDQAVSKLNEIFQQVGISFSSEDVRQTEAEKQSYLIPNQIKRNYGFASDYSLIFAEIMNLKQSGSRFVIYGNGSFGQTIDKFLGDACIAIVDNNSSLVGQTADKKNIHSPKSLEYIEFDKIIISLLGRENEIIKDLVEKHHVAHEKIIKFKIRQKGRYEIC
ncbi:glycosyltransferase family 9 protein [Sulfurimonas sp. HSL-1716]|uniref:glycosyltransferase family 9 protein n=1 Tax=Hydrocurvibacter sulfurireducens TaxID=3131937 RepID=UPI0031F84D3D